MNFHALYVKIPIYYLNCELNVMESPKYAIVDIETTGHSHTSGDRIIQIAIVIMQDWEIQKTYTKFIQPGKPIPAFIQDLTNISDRDVAEAEPFEMYADYIYELLSDCIFVAHNTDFDLPFLQAEFRRVGLPQWNGKKIDTVELSKILFPMALSYKLGDLANDLNIPLKQAHRADDDAMATALLLKKCWQHLMVLPQITIEMLHKRSFRLKSNISNLLFDALFSKRRIKEDDSAWQFYKKIALKKIKNYEPNWHDSHYPTSKENKVKLFQKVLPTYEERPQQLQMMDTVWQGFINKQETVIEASTGIGKTLAYLLPAYYYALQTQKQVVISTYTSTLMDQLLQEEVSKLSNMVDHQVQVAVLKGMSNYVDVDRFSQFLYTLDESYDETFAILQVVVWLTQTNTGDLSELNMSGGGQLFVEKIRKSTDSFQTPEQIDYYQIAVERTKYAHIIVTNHAYVFSDAERLQPVFQQIGGWIFDEAHQVVQAAISKNEKVFYYTNWKYMFGQIGTFEDGQLFAKLQRFVLKKQLVPSHLLRKCEKQFVEVAKVFDDVMQAISKELEYMIERENIQSLKFTLFLDEIQLPSAKLFYFTNVFQTWIQLAEEITTYVLQSVEQLSSEHQTILNDWRYFVNEGKLKLAEWGELFGINAEKDAIWIEADQRSIPGSIQMFKRPIDIADMLETTFAPIRAKSPIIWTSGTLTVPDNKTFITKQLNIADDVPIYELKAPDSYYEGAKTYIVTDMPDINRVPQMDYIEAVAKAVVQLVTTTQGRCFVLFTSQDMLKKTYQLIQESHVLDDYLLFAQGVTSGSKMKLLKAFQKFNKSVLFGTNSFWEGVDVPGEGLAAVIVVRLPFSSPDEPTFKIRSRKLNAEGHNAFQKLALPEAVLRLKQGFGRLVRASGDKGFFIILDRRIETKSYGKQFIESIPSKTVEKLPLVDVVTQLEHWYNK
jgi:ATP-dependent DNA helicase DinG